jgi:hypothetical protein
MCTAIELLLACRHDEWAMLAGMERVCLLLLLLLLLLVL